MKTKLILVIALLALIHAPPAQAVEDCLAKPCTVNEGTTGALWVTFCSDARTVTDPTNCPRGGVLLSTAEVTNLSWRVDDRATNCELLDDTTPASITANPHKVVIAAADNVMVGRCSNNAATCCDADADCGTGTCAVTRKTQPQEHLCTLVWTHPGGTGTMEVPFFVVPLTQYPYP